MSPAAQHWWELLVRPTDMGLGAVHHGLAENMEINPHPATIVVGIGGYLGDIFTHRNHGSRQVDRLLAIFVH